MLDADKKYYLEDVIEITGISERNVKFWVAEYRLKVFKEGRKNLYPAKTITLLNLIKELTESKLFTTKFIQIQVERCKNPHKTTIKGLQNLDDITKRMLQYIFEMTEADQIERVADEAISTAGETQDKADAVEEFTPDVPAQVEVDVDPALEEQVRLDELTTEVTDGVFKPMESLQDESIRKVLKELKSPIITLANESRERKLSFWQQIKKILR